MRLTATDRNTLRKLTIIVACSTIGGAAFGSAMTGSNVIFDPRPVTIGSYNGFLSHLDSLPVTMSQKPSRIKLP